MNYLFNEIIARVRVAMDENRIENEVIENDDTLELDDIIAQKVVMALREVLVKAPLELITMDCVERLSAGWSHVTIGSGMAWVATLPDDWLRLVGARVSDWHRLVPVAVSESDEAALTVYSEFEGIVPSAERPLVVIGEGADGPELRLHGGDGEVSTVLYVALPAVRDGVIRIPERLEDAVVYLAAAQTCSAIEDNRAGVLYQLADKAMGVEAQQAEAQSQPREYYNRDGRKRRR